MKNGGSHPEFVESQNYKYHHREPNSREYAR